MHASPIGVLARLGLVPLLLGGAAVAGEGAEPVGVCDVLRTATLYSDKILTVRGEYLATPEITILRGDRCDPPVEIPLPFASGIWLAGHGMAKGEAPFSLNREATEAFYEFLSQSREKRRDPRFVVTVVGKLEIEWPLRTVWHPVTKKWIPRGFGHLSAWPAQIVVKTYRDWEVVDPDSRAWEQ